MVTIPGCTCLRDYFTNNNQKLLNALLLLLQAGPLVLCAALERRNKDRGDYITDAEVEASRILEEPYNPVHEDGTNLNDPFDKVRYKEKEKLWSKWGTRIGSRGDKPAGLRSRAVEDGNDPFDRPRTRSDDAESALGPLPPTKEASSNSDLGRGVEGAEVPESVQRGNLEDAFAFDTGHHLAPGEVAAKDLV
ncbi:hypothetical protein CTA2_6992 [Colletotrichum tanaceti]|uniref:Uncharacterized protein n=1 Tax=Colletotrichum tanaceti TaxID=1306861 RepID=A0A4U6XFU9_9PEZI|nr:hypothetical protein CTA2_6992 [Colletotrichum tanaceti]TKW52847.1 hypothetical protein CTA1_12575 [Colletotrichum tanaceti]